jgi:hypothetical protein
VPEPINLASWRLWRRPSWAALTSEYRIAD